MCGKIKIRQGSKIIPVEIKDIVRFEGGKGNCCYIFLVNGQSYKITGNIGDWMKNVELIAPGLFLLVHRSHFINYKRVVSYAKTHGATMSNNDSVPLTREGFEALEKRIFSEYDITENGSSPSYDRRIALYKRESIQDDELTGNDEEE